MIFLKQSGEIAGPDGSQSGAAADAQRSHAILVVGTDHLVNQGDDDTQSGAANGMAQSDTGAELVGLVPIDDIAVVFLQHSLNTQNLSGESFVDFEVIDVFPLQASGLQSLGHSHCGAEAHDFGSNAFSDTGDQLSHGLLAQFLALFPAHQDDCCSSVVDAGSVSSGDDAVLLEGGLQLSQGFHGAAADGMFVIGDDLFALLGLDHDGNDFILEDAFVDGLASQVVGTDSDLVAFFTGDAILFR